MWTKIYLIFFAVAFLTMGVLTYLSYAQLQSIGFAPSIIAGNFLSYAGTYWTVFWIFSLALLILANVVLWLNRRAWALWLTLLFFSIFVLLRTWWLNEVYVNYTKQNNLTAETLFGFGILGVLLCIIAAVGIFFNQFLVLRMRDRIHSVDKTAIAEINEPEIAEINEEKQAIEDKA
ncbi:MAG TPA: hypothetical protein VF721_00705 [Pyrinomonadaceae bacterium]|jgi:hypothetical protein